MHGLDYRLMEFLPAVVRDEKALQVAQATIPEVHSADEGMWSGLRPRSTGRTRPVIFMRSGSGNEAGSMPGGENFIERRPSFMEFMLNCVR